MAFFGQKSLRLFCFLGSFILSWLSLDQAISAKAMAEDSVSIQKIKNRGVLVVAVYFKDYAPFFFVNKKGELKGSDVDLAHELARKIGVKITFDRSAKTYDALVESVVQGKVDIAISCLSVTPQRLEKVLFTDSYITLKKTLLINRSLFEEYKKLFM